MMKKLLCCLMATLLLLSAALADTSLITGEVVEIPNPGDVRVVLGEDGFEASFNDFRLYGKKQSDGTLLIGTRDVALKVPAQPDMSLINSLSERLEQETVYKNSIYSSLFTRARQIKLTANEVCSLLLSAINLCPLLDRDGEIRSVVSQSYDDETWGTITRYSAADESQYPNALALQINIDSPLLPAIWIEYYRTDDSGNNFKLAMTREKVIDWDETLAAISEADAGDTSLGQLIDGFSIRDDNGSQIWTYVETDFRGFEKAWHIEADIFQDSSDASSWEADIAVTDRAENVPVASITLNSESTSLVPQPELDNARIIDSADGLDAEEWSLLGL